MTIEAAVVDASVALKWVLPEPDSAEALALRALFLVAPDLLLAECGNAIWNRVRTRVLTLREARSCYAEISRAPLIWAPIGELAAESFELSLRLDHPVNDCIYLALAIARGLPLVTADRRLLVAVSKAPFLVDLVRPLSRPLDR